MRRIPILFLVCLQCSAVKGLISVGTEGHHSLLYVRGRTPRSPGDTSARTSSQQVVQDRECLKTDRQGTRVGRQNDGIPET